MWKYPIKSDKIGYVSLKEACQWCNKAFFDGFMSAHYETADEWERMTVEERIGYCCMAVERCAILRREAPPELNFSGGQSNSPYSLQAITAHCNGREGAL